MTKYIAEHNQWIRNHLHDFDASYHDRKIAQLQHERLIHLLVTIFVGLTLILMFLGSLLLDILLLYVLDFILTGLFIFYIRHYYLLENTVQNWYQYPKYHD